MNTLLITATIKPLVKVKYSDPEIRSEEYRRNLIRYIRDTDFDRIIFAENSGYPFDVSALRSLAAEYGKELFVLDLSASADTTTMSTGEANLMRQALDQCGFLNDNDAIWKVTGRVYIRNANRILRSCMGKIAPESGIFLYAPRYDSIQTWFFRATVGDLKRYFLTEQVIERMSRSCIEYAWMDCWRENADRIPMCPFRIYPDAEGINSSGVPYTLPRMKLVLKNLLLKVGYFTVRKK